ncbi:MAG: hypothetical protein U1F70_13285 [Candidatus Competibacteraceae bacterium]
MTPISLIVVVIWFALGSLILLLAALDVDAAFRLYYSNVMQTLSSVLSAILCYRTMADFPGGSPMRKVWGFLGSGMLAWGIGAALFSSYPLLNDGAETPYPYYSDIGYLSLVPLVVIALLLMKNALGVSAPLWGKLMSVLLFAGAMIISVMANWNGVIGEGIVLPLVSICYIFFDPILLAITMQVASALYGGVVGKAWWYVLAGLVLYFIANQTYTYLVFTKQYATGSPIDALWVFGFGMIAMAAMMTHTLFKGVRSS